MQGGNSLPSSLALSQVKPRFSQRMPSPHLSSAPPVFANTVKQSECRRSRRLQTKPPINNPSNYVDQSGNPVKCCICSKCNLGQAVIKCNNCRKCVHSYCLDPPLNQIPTRKSFWICLSCVSRTKQGLPRTSSLFNPDTDDPSVAQASANSGVHSVRFCNDTESVPLRRENSRKRLKLSLGTNTLPPVPIEFFGNGRVRASLVGQSIQCGTNGSISFKALSNTRHGNWHANRSKAVHAPLGRSSVRPVVGQVGTVTVAAENETLLGSQLKQGVDKGSVKGCNRTYREAENPNEHLSMQPEKRLPARGCSNAGNFDVWDQEAVLHGPTKTLGILEPGLTDFRSVSFETSLARPHIRNVADEEKVEYTGWASGGLVEGVIKNRMKEDAISIPAITPLLPSEPSTVAVKAIETDRYLTDILQINTIIPTVVPLISEAGRKHSEKGASPSGIVDPKPLGISERPTSSTVLLMTLPQDKRHEFSRGTHLKCNEEALTCQVQEKCQGEYQHTTDVNKNSVIMGEKGIGNFSGSFGKSPALGIPIIQSERPWNISMGSVAKGGHSPLVDKGRTKEGLNRVEVNSVSQLYAEQTGPHRFENAALQLMAVDGPNVLTYFPPSTSILK